MDSRLLVLLLLLLLEEAAWSGCSHVLVERGLLDGQEETHGNRGCC